MKTECVHIKRGGIELQVNRGNKVFGTLTVSNATISWFPKNAKKSMEFSWVDFDKLIKAKIQEVCR